MLSGQTLLVTPALHEGLTGSRGTRVGGCSVAASLTVHTTVLTWRTDCVLTQQGQEAFHIPLEDGAFIPD